MKKACLLSLLLLVTLTVVYWFWFSGIFDPPANWIGAPIAGLLATAAVGAVLKARLAHRRLRLLDAAEAGGVPRDGGSLAAVGPLLPAGPNILQGPFSGEDCLLCEIEISAAEQRERGDTRTLFFGHLQAPCHVQTPFGPLRLWAFPDLSEIPSHHHSHEEAGLARAREHVLNAPYQDATRLAIHRKLGAALSIYTTTDGEVQQLWRDVPQPVMDELRRPGRTPSDAWEAAQRCVDEAIGPLQFREKCVASGTSVVVFGRYDAQRQGIVHGGAEIATLSTGSVQSIYRQLRSQAVSNLVGGLAALLIGNLALYGISRIYQASPEVQEARDAQLLEAVQAGDLLRVQTLLEQDVDPNATDSRGQTSLHLAEDPAIVQALIVAGGNVNFARQGSQSLPSSEDGDRPLHVHARRGRLEIVNRLIDAGAELDAYGGYGHTPLMEAARHRHLDVVQRLVAAGAQLDLRSSDHHQTALMMVDEGSPVADFLLASGAYNDVVTAENGQPLPADGGAVIAAINRYLLAVQADDLAALVELQSRHLQMDFDFDRTEWRNLRPTSVQQFSGFTRGDDATVIIGGTNPEGQYVRFRYQMVREDGQWRLARGRLH